MVEGEPRPHRCLFCNSSFSVEILSKIEDDKGDVYCENCGDLIKKVNNKDNLNIPIIAENESKTKINIKERPVKHRKKLKPNPDALHYPIGRVFYDTDFPLTFKSNFIIVFSRLICYSALRLDQAGEIDLRDLEPSENVINDLYMATRVIQNKRVKPEFLNNLRESSTEEFEGNLKKIQNKIQTSRQYLEDFLVYSRWLIRRVFCIIAENKPDDRLTIFEKTILNDLHLLNIDDLKLTAGCSMTTDEKNGELEKSITYDLSLTNSITYEDYLSLIETREDISVGMTRTEFYTTLVNRGNTTQSEITLKWKCTKKKHSWEASYHSIRNGDGCPRCPKNSKAITKEKFSGYNTKDLINDLRDEIQILSEDLAQMFPNRLMNRRGNAYGNRDLSRLWVNNEHFIAYQLKLAKKDSDFIINKKALSKLKKKLGERLKVKAIGCLHIIELYQSKEINILQFVNILEKELGRVSGEIQLRNEELSLILVGTHGFIREILERMSIHEYHPAKNLNYKFSKECLRQFRESLFGIFGDRAKKCFNLLKKYEDRNLDLKEYSKQQFKVKNPHYFQDIENKIEASYWFGFMRADGSIGPSDRYRIYIELAEKDKDRLEEFAKVIGLPIDRVKFRTRFKWYKGNLKSYNSAYIQFVCKPMVEALNALGFQSSKAEQKSVPSYVVQALKNAKKNSKQTSIQWWLTLPGRVALAFLLGFFDGDGYYSGVKSARIYANSKQFLEHIKDLFNIKNRVCEDKTPGETLWVFDEIYISKGMYSLALGPKLFEKMLKSYNLSMQRKRPKNIG